MKTTYPIRFFLLSLVLLEHIPRSVCFLPSRICSKQKRRVVVLPCSNNDECNTPLMTPPISMTTKVTRSILDILRDSKFIKEKHREHVESDTVTHIFKGTPFAAASDTLKLQFVNSWAGRALSSIVQEEGIYLRDWKIDRIREAAGNFDMDAVWKIWGPDALSDFDVVVYSFEDCPWCIAAEELLHSLSSYRSGKTKIKIVKLEDLGLIGKQLRAILAEETGRTSMPCIYINRQPIGGFTDGEPCGVGLKVLEETGELEQLLK